MGGIPLRNAGSALLAAVVATVKLLVTAEVPLTVTEEGENVQVDRVGQPLATVRLTVPVNAPCGVVVTVEVPDCPGAEMSIEVGFADTEKSPTATLAEEDWELA